MKIKMEDISAVAESDPGLLHNFAALRKNIAEKGPMTLAQLLHWQADNAPTRQTQIGDVQVNVNGIDMLDRVLNGALKANEALQTEVRSAHEHMQTLREELAEARQIRVHRAAQVTIVATLDDVRQAVAEAARGE